MFFLIYGIKFFLEMTREAQYVIHITQVECSKICILRFSKNLIMHSFIFVTYEDKKSFI
jgi:hypothetical protein